MKSTKLLGVMILSLILAGCGGDTVNVDAAKYLDTLAVTADPPIPAPTLGKGFFTQQFHATANYSDGTAKDASGLVTWTTSNDAMITIDNNGLGTINLININANDLYGDVTIWADFATVFDSVILTISPPAPGAPADTLAWDIKENVGG
jgi:hypothetical protein